MNHGEVCFRLIAERLGDDEEDIQSETAEKPE
jgi:hypothetical protein